MILTKRQRELLEFLKREIDLNGYAPTLEEIARRLNISSISTVHKHLLNLEKKGLIRRRWNHSRAIEIVGADERPGAIELPLLGVVAAGRPIETIETDDTFVVPESFVRRSNTFVLRVRGDSMIDDGIWDGDFIVVESRSTADSGETVVALVRGEATVKRLQRRGDRIRLMPANDRIEPIDADARDVEVRGVVVAVLRKFV